VFCYEAEKHKYSGPWFVMGKKEKSAKTSMQNTFRFLCFGTVRLCHGVSLSYIKARILFNMNFSSKMFNILSDHHQILKSYEDPRFFSSAKGS